MIKSLAGALLLVVLIAGVAVMFFPGEPVQEDGMKAGAFDPPRAAPDFSLRGSDGSEVTLARYRGNVVLLTFGFTSCAAVCPTTLATLAQARRALGKAADSVQVVFVTVDPHRDSAPHMQQYLAAFDSSFIGATSDPEVLSKVQEAYGVTAVREGAGPDYAMAHTSSIFLIDRSGKLRGIMPFGRDAVDYAHDVAYLLKR